jgi:ribonuclease R
LLTGERSGREYRLLDRLRVRLSKVDIEQRKIDFVPVEPAGDKSPGSKPARKRSRRGRQG